MYTKTGSGIPRADSISVVEGKLRFSPGLDPEPVAELVAVYSNKSTGITYGTCPMLSTMFSSKTKEALLNFLKSAEEDFGRAFFGEESTERSDTDPGSYAQAETSQGVRARYLGGL